MDMPGMTNAPAATSTMSMPSSQTSAAMDMSGMMGNCKINMLWNWYTIDACFLSSSWQITSHGMFAGSCIGVVCLVIVLEFLRRAVKEFDRFLVRQHVAKHLAAAGGYGPVKNDSNARIPLFRPSIFQQAVRALLHMLQFAVAYFIMLLAMYYNGYIIICIFIGAFLGSFIFQWETLSASGDQSTSAANEATVCCG